VPSRSKVVVAVSALAALGFILPLFGDPRVTPLTHPLWARMLLRSLEMDDAVKVTGRASLAFDTLSGRHSRFFPAWAYLRADGVVSDGNGTTRRISSTQGVGEATYVVSIVQAGDYLLRARLSGDAAQAASADIARISGGPAIHTFSLLPELKPGWVVGGTAHLDPGTYGVSVLLPAGTSLEFIEVAPPCVNPVEPIGGWKPTATTTAQDLAVTILRALDMEDALAAAAAPIERGALDFDLDAAAIAVDTRGETKALAADAAGLQATLSIDLPEAGLYTLEAFVDPGQGVRWRMDGCRKVILCPGSPRGWRTVMAQYFSPGRHSFAVALGAQATVERVRVTRRKDAPEEYVAAIRRAGFDVGSGEISRATAIAAASFVRDTRAYRAAHFCGDVVLPNPQPPALPANVTVAAAPAVAPPPPAVAAPLANVLLPPQEVASPVLPGPS
jgi:hypothetical protein